MIRLLSPALLCRLVAFLALLSIPARAEDAADTKSKPTAHQTRNIEGWTVRIDERLLSGPDTEVGAQAIKLLGVRLYEITMVLKGEPLQKLQTIKIQLDLHHGDLRAMQYHPSADWLKENGYSETLAKCVHIPDAANFLSRFETHRMPWVVMHELAHGYHDQILGFDEPRIQAAYDKFVASGKYENVLMITGRMRKHYGLTNAKEFFAEMTETYLGTNDFYPFVAGELQRDEPELFRLMADIWGPLPLPEKQK